MSESQQAESELLAFIRGEGKYSAFGGGIWTHPNADDNNRQLHDACLKLEKQGLIRRIQDEPDYVIWGAVPCN
jgi:hypothetical protein